VARSQQPLARTLTALVDEQSRQKVRVSRLLHDEVGQILSAVGLHLDVLRLDVEADSPEVADRLQTCQKHLEQAFGQIRKLSQEMNPAVVERAGLATALDRLVDRYRERHHNTHLLFDSSVRLPLEVATAFYKIAECGLDNAVRHSQADRIDVVVKPSRGGVALEVRDNGTGFDSVTAIPGLGLLLIGHFAAQAGLRSRVTSRAGKGTIVKAHCSAARQGHGFERSSR